MGLMLDDKCICNSSDVKCILNIEVIFEVFR